MQGKSEDRTTPPSHLAAVVAAVLIGSLLIMSISSDPEGDGPTSPVITLADLPISDPANLEGRSGRVILLEDYVVSGAGLDTLVVERLLAPQLLPEEEYPSPADYRAAGAYLAQIGEYKTLLDLQSFGDAAKKFATDPEKSVPDNVRQQFNEVPGGRLVMDSLGNPTLLRELSRLTMMGTERMKGLEYVRKVGNLYRTEWGFSEGAATLAGPDAAVAKESDLIRQILRLWELGGDRYLVCHAGNPVISRFVQSMFPGSPRPVYANGLNAVLDPGGRRFRTVATYWPENPAAAAGGSASSSGTRMVPVAEGPFALVEFQGALPTAKLYADWVVDESPESARKTLMSPGFNPQQQVLVRQAGLAAPERPAATAELPPLQLETTPNGGTEIRIPPLEYDVVLLMNEEFDPARKVVVDDQPVALLPANLAMTAIHLPAAGRERRVILSAVGGRGISLKVVGFVALALIVIFLVMSRRGGAKAG